MPDSGFLHSPEDPDSSVGVKLAKIRTLLQGDIPEAIALALNWMADEESHLAGLLATGLIATRRRLFPFANEAFLRAGEAAAIRWAAEEFARASLTSGASGLEAWRHLDPAILRRLEYAFGAPPAEMIPVPAVPCFAIMGFDSFNPDQSSNDIGDYLECAAALEILSSTPGIELQGEAELIRIFESICSPKPSVTQLAGLVGIERDKLAFVGFESPVWGLVSGLTCRRVFEGRFPFPFPKNFHPIFAGIHLEKPEMLNESTISYFKEFEPIGCRDWATCFALLSLNVDAFLSGSIIAAGALPRIQSRKQTTARIGLGDGENAVKFSQTQKTLANRPLYERLQLALSCRSKWLEHKRIETSGLESYVSALGNGSAVEFRPKDRTDRRIDGIWEVSPEQLLSEGQSLRSKLQAIVRLVLEDNAPSIIYESWTSLNRERVRLAKDRLGRPKPKLRMRFDPDAAKFSQNAIKEKPIVELALAVDAHYKCFLPTVLDSILENTSAKCRLWLLSRSMAENESDELIHLFPNLDIRVCRCDEIDYGPVVGMLPHLSISTMDRLMLPKFLPDIEKVLYLDLDILVKGDVAELFAIALGEAPFAGRPSLLEEHWLGYNLVYRAARRFDFEHASELRERMHSLHPLGFQSVNAGVLLANLRKMREDKFCENFIPFAEHYGMYDQEILNCYAGPNRVELSSEWNSLPAQDFPENAKILHWAGKHKPWNSPVPARELWLAQHEKTQKRIGAGSLFVRAIR